MQELKRKAGESANEWYQRLLTTIEEAKKLKTEAKKIASVEANLVEMKRRAKRDGLPLERVVAKSNLNTEAALAVMKAADAEGAK